MLSVHFDLEALLERTAALHRHLCPRQVLGVRIGILAGEMLPLELPQNGKRLLAFVETDGCFADGVSVATGCSIGHRTMRVVDYGKVAATFVDSVTRRAWRIWPSPNARTRAVEFVPEAANRWKAQLEAYQRIPNEELLISREVTLTVDLTAILGKPGTRTTCCLCGEEVLNQREVMKDGQPMCKGCAGERYWR
jgi:formylmethanofuran dehydrogenase subunit E